MYARVCTCTRSDSCLALAGGSLFTSRLLHKRAIFPSGTPAPLSAPSSASLIKQAPISGARYHLLSSRRTMTGATATDDGIIFVSFDVDGTLIKSAGQRSNMLHKQAFSYGFKKVFDLDTHIDIIQHHGGTDPLIILKVLEVHGISKEEAMAKLKDVEAAMVEHTLANKDKVGEGLVLLPGVKDLLEKLQASGKVATCLVTGNLEAIGWAKMEALGISHLFSQPAFGGFGSDFCSGNTEEMWHDRAELVRVAVERCSKQFPGPIKSRFHVGDTPNDIQAAIKVGAVPVGVTTGIYTTKQLQEYCTVPESVLLEGLHDVEGMLKVLGL